MIGSIEANLEHRFPDAPFPHREKFRTRYFGLIFHFDFHRNPTQPKSSAND